MVRCGNTPIQGEMLQGTLDLLVLRTLAIGPAHGHTIAHAIERQSAQASRWQELVRAIDRVLRPA